MGDDGFDEFYRVTSRRVLRFAYAMVGDGATAQDITQEAYIRVFLTFAGTGGDLTNINWFQFSR